VAVATVLHYSGGDFYANKLEEEKINSITTDSSW